MSLTTTPNRGYRFPDTQTITGTGTALDGLVAGLMVNVDPTGALTTGSGGKYNAATPTLSDGQQSGLQLDVNGNLKTNTRLLTASDVVTVAGGSILANAQLYDGYGNQIRGVSPTGGTYQLQVNTNEASTQIINWNSAVITTTAATYGALDARHFRELVILVNITAVNTAVVFSYQVQDGNGLFLTVWSESFNATGIQYLCVGPGYTAGTGRNISLGPVGQLSVQATGTNATIKGTAWMRT